MDFSDPKFWLSLAQWLVIIVIGIVTFARRPGEDATKAIAALTDRVSRLEETMKHVPTNEELARMGGELRECNARVENVVDGQRRISNQLDLMQRYLQESKK